MIAGMMIVVGLLMIVVSLCHIVFSDPPSGYNMGTGDDTTIPKVASIVGLILFVLGMAIA